jgi:regulatory protein
MAFQRAKKREPVGEPELFEYAVGALERKMRTVRDLRRLMQLRAHEGERGARDIDAVIARLIGLNYLSDTRFAADYTRLRKENQGFGRRRVQQDLTQKGVAKDLVATTLAAAYDETDEVALARAFCERKRMPQPADQRETVRTMNRLLRAGYSSTAIFKLLRAWNVPEEAIPAVGGDSDSYAEPDEAMPADD